ncbi:MAG: hypothetical protein LGB07_03085 [Sulfurovum sp.]|nr:hypothetical protein [Sulfurovum sp.]
MPFSLIFNVKEKCSDNDCKVNKKNIKTIFKPDDGFLNKSLEKSLFPSNSYKICDCIIICNNDNIVIVEILCGKLTYSEYTEKYQQLENCYKVVQSQGLENRIKKVVLQYKRLENSKRNPQFRKKLINPKINGRNLELLKEQTVDISC